MRTARVVESTEEEVDRTPRRANEDEASEALGSTRASIDLSPDVALISSLVIVAEAGLRLRLGRRLGLRLGRRPKPSGPSEPASRAS